MGFQSQEMTPWLWDIMSPLWDWGHIQFPKTHGRKIEANRLSGTGQPGHCQGCCLPPARRSNLQRKDSNRAWVWQSRTGITNVDSPLLPLLAASCGLHGLKHGPLCCCALAPPVYAWQHPYPICSPCYDIGPTLRRRLWSVSWRCLSTQCKLWCILAVSY